MAIDEASDVGWLAISIRTRNALRHWGIRTVGSLLRRSRSDLLMDVPNLGRKTANEIEEALAKVGLRLRQPD